MELTSMKNIGAEMERKLNSVGISSAEQLSHIGSKEAFIRLKAAYPEICLVHLYTLHGAVNNLDFNMLPQEIKEDLRSFSDSLK